MAQGMNPYQAPSAQSLSQQADRDWKWLLFSFDGRATRWDYWRGILCLIFGFMTLVGATMVPVRMMLGEMEDLGPSAAVVFGTVSLILMVPMFWIALAVQVKRWHDRGKSGLWVLVGVIPYLGFLWVLVECGCLRGTSGDNAYGPDPLF